MSNEQFRGTNPIVVMFCGALVVAAFIYMGVSRSMANKSLKDAEQAAAEQVITSRP